VNLRGIAGSFLSHDRFFSAAGGTGAVRSDGPLPAIIGLTGGRLALVMESAGTLRACSRGPGNLMNRPVPLAREIVLQVAVKDIGQLTDI
jgi:hypothetical protein